MAQTVFMDNQLNDMALALKSVCDASSKHSENREKSSHITNSDLYEVRDAAAHFRALANKVNNNWG
jgi:hypothetical protein